MLKAAVIGSGNIARMHAPALFDMENVELTAFVDKDISRAEFYQEKYGGKVYSSIEELFEADKPDVVHLCLPHNLHVPMALKALKAGVKVFMEKPVALNQEEFAKLAKAQTPETLGICFQNRYNPCSRKAKELIESGTAGKVLGVRGLVTWAREMPYYHKGMWRANLEEAGGGVLMNQSIHTLDLMTWLAGEKPLSVIAAKHQHHLPVEVEDTMTARICYDNGVLGYYFATSGYFEDCPPIIEISCENMKIRIEDPILTIIYPDGRREQPELTAPEAFGKSCWGGGHNACIRDFYRCLEDGCKVPIAFEDVYDTTKLTLACYESSETGTTVEIK